MTRAPGKFGPASTVALLAARVAVADANIYEELDKLTPNFTRMIQRLGYNVSAPFEDSLGLDWDLSIELYADVPGQVDENEDRFVAATHFFWNPAIESLSRKADGSAEVDPDWYYCTLELKDHLVSDTDEVDSGCRDVVPAECLEELETITSNASWCNITSWPDACMALSVDHSQLHMYGQVNLTEIPTSFIAFPYNRDGHKKGDTKDFKSAMKRVWIVMTGFAKSTPAGKLDLDERVVMASEHSCLRAYSPSDPASTARGTAGSLPTITTLAAAIVAVLIGVFAA